MRAFSLVELSIVLVILGLLTGGILSGQSLIRAAELRSVMTEFQTYQTAAQIFRDRYMALPGDMRNATAFWGRNELACGSDSGADKGTAGTCNGNGNGIIEEGSGPNATSESFQFWKQLALAGFIEGSYTGQSGATGGLDHDVGVNCPKSRLSNGMWSSTRSDNTNGTATVVFRYDYRNSLNLGTDDDNIRADGRLFTAEEAWNIDSKMDDGKPAQGKIHGFSVSSCTTADDNNNNSADYKIGTAGITCALIFYKPY